jgi:hypothetical protein
MSISAVGSDAAKHLSLFQQRRQDLADMVSAVQSGDLATARETLAAYQQNTLKAQAITGYPAGQRSRLPQSSPLKSDLSTIGGFIRSGDLAAAQSVLAGLERDREAGAAQPSGAGENPMQSTADLGALLDAFQPGQGAGQGTTADTTGAPFPQNAPTLSSEDNDLDTLLAAVLAR